MAPGSVATTARSSALRTTFVLAPLVWTQTSFPSGETRSMYGLLPLGKPTVLTICRVATSNLETVSASRSGV